MKKAKGTKSLIGKVVFAITLVTVLFALIFCAVIKQYNKYGNKNFELFRSDIKYFVVGFALLLIIMLFFFVCMAYAASNGTELATPEYFGVDFEKDAKEKEKLKSVEASDKVETALAAVNSKTSEFEENGEPASVSVSATERAKTSENALSSAEGSRFYMLTEIDKAYEKYSRPAYNDEIGLRELCEAFRNFSAGKLKLYYDIADIRRFIGALAVTKLIILQGMSGTGKTSLAYAFGEFLDNKTVVVPIQPMWKERTDLVGYYNEFTRRFNETTLLYKMYEANCNEEIYVTVLDEMNIARVEYYFAEFLSLLEIPNPDGRNLDVVADKWDDDPKLLQHNGKLRLPTNMWFVGTANNDDSTFSISDKVYDRAMVLNLDKKAVPFDASDARGIKLSATHLEKLFERAWREYALSDRNMRRIKKLDEYMIQTFHITFGNRIMKQIRAYVPVLVACGGTELEALDDILSRKVFRKLESKNPVYVKQMADGVCGYLDELFGEDKMALCKEAIRLIEQNV